MPDASFIALLVLALVFDFLNGFHDSANIVATPISSNALRPRAALLLAAAAEFSGPFLFGVAVAKTIGADLLRAEALKTDVLIAALAAAVLWNLLTWYLGIPSSSSHALIGGLLGGAVVSMGMEVVQARGLLAVLLALFISPPAGLLAGFMLMRFVLWLFRDAPPTVNNLFRRLQVFTLFGLGLGHGTNDAQKTMGVITLGLVTAGYLDTFRVPTWVIVVSAAAIALGTSIGGWRLIRTLGGRLYRIRPVHGFTSQVAGAGVILGAALVGGPVSTTQVLSSAIMGVGAAERLSKVRWMVLRDMALAWVLTIPATALLAAVLFLAIEALFFGG